MQANIKRSALEKMLSFVLAAVLMISFVLDTAVRAIAADGNGDFNISLSWNKSEDPRNFVYDSDSLESKMARLKISYSNKEVSKSFEAGEITITVTGLKDAVRSGNSYIPAGVAADKVTDSPKNYEWSYSYTAATDTFTFTNNSAIAEKSTFEGSFEIIWSLPSRETKDNFTKDIDAKLYTPETSVQSNSITYSQSRTPDKYEIVQSTSKLFKDKLPLDDYEEHIWVSYDIGATDTYCSKDVEGNERFECYFLADAKVTSDDLTDSGETVTIDGKAYKKYYSYKNVTDSDNPYYLNNILVAYPKSAYDFSSQVTNYVKLCGTYYESQDSDYEDEVGLLAQNKSTIALADYDFNDIPGDIYKVWKTSYGMHGEYINNHCSDCKNNGAVNSVNLSNGKGTYYSALGLLLNFYSESIKHPESYDLEFVDDIIDVELNDGTIRRLRDDEFNFTKVYIPSTYQIYNNNGFTISSADTVNEAKNAVRAGISSGAYAVEIYVRHKGAAATDFELLETEQTNDLKIRSEGQTIDLPKDTVGVKIRVVDVKEGFLTSDFRCYYQFHTDDTDISTNGGKVLNNMYFKLNATYYDDGGNRHVDVPINDYKNIEDPVEKEKFLTSLYGADYENSREYKRDIKLYSEPLDREVGKIHVLEIPNEFKLTSTTIAPDTSINSQGLSNLAYHFLGSINSEFTLGEGTELSNFSIYTIIPDGLRLSEDYNDPEALKDVLKFSSSGGYSSAEIASHTNITIIDDPDSYDGRQYIKFDFDFSDSPITTKNLSISGIPMYVLRHNVPYGRVNYTLRAAMLVDQAGKWYSNSTDNNNLEDSIWVDIDGDGDTSEPASFASSTYILTNSENYEMILTKYVSTPYSNGLVNPSAKADIADVPKTDEGGEYSYFLCARVNTGVAKNIVFVDAIEPDDISEWQGEFVGVDYSQVVSQLTYENGVIPPTIYYSSKVEKEESYTKTDASGNVTVNRDAFKTGNWTTEKPAVVRSIAVDFGEGVANNGMDMMLEIKMKAPTDPNNYNKIATNSCSVGYEWIQKTDDTKSYPDYLTSNTVPVRYVPKCKVILTKKDGTSGKTITGATFELYKKGEDAPDKLIGTYKTNDNGRITVGNLEYGVYYFKETDAPKGYEVSNSNSEEIRLSEDHPTQSINFENTRKKGSITLKKVSDRLLDLALQGAEFMLYREDGTEVSDKTFVTDSNGEIKITGLEWGKYYLLETKAPKGYELSSDKIEFEINADTVEAPELKTVTNKQKPATAVLEKYELSNKYGEFSHDGNGNINAELDEASPISGAVYELFDENGKKLSSNVTDADGKIYAEDLTFGRYYFLEKTPSKGYSKYDEKIWFEVNADHTSANLVVKTADTRKTGSVWLQKSDDKGELVKGATYSLFDKNGNKRYVTQVNPGKGDGKYKYSDSASGTTDMITSSEGIIEIEGLHWGEYYLQETASPKGYELNPEKYEFTVDKDTVMSTIIKKATDNRHKGTVELTKCDEKDESHMLSGAVFTLYNNDGSVYRDDLVTDENGKLKVENIDWGSYYFLEKTAPAGYGLNPQKIRFSVNNITAGKVQEITVTDPQKNYKLTINKKILQSDAVLAHGNPTFTFEVKNTASGRTYYKTVTFGSDNITPGGVGYAEASVVFALPMGEYEISEISVDRYRLSVIEPAKYAQGDKAVVKLDDTNPEGGVSVSFTNDKTDQSKTTDNSMVTNILNCARKLTAIVADYHGPTTVTSDKISPDDLTVYAVYDDGTQITVVNYTLNPETLSYENNGDFEISVSYTDGGITRKDSFIVNVNLPSPFTAQFVSQNADGTYTNADAPTEYTDSDGTTYDGLVKITGYIGDSSVINFPATLTGYIQTDSTSEDPTYAGKKFKVVGIEALEPSGANTSDISPIYVKNGITSVSSISFAEGIEYIGLGAFKEFKGLTCELELPSTLKSIGHHAFYSCRNLTGDIMIPSGVTKIEQSTFEWCTGLNGNLTFAEGSKLETIGKSAFYNCFKLTGDLTIPAGVTEIGEAAFMQCNGFNGNLIFAEGSKLKTIGKQAFKASNGMNLNGNLILPESLETIGDEAFRKCNKFTGDLVIPKNVKTIGNNAFMSCSGFNGTLTFEADSNLTSIGDYAFSANGWSYDAPKFTGGIALPDKLETIGDHAFFTCSGFNGNLTLPSQLKEIKSWAFYGCSNLKSEGLYIPDTVEVLGNRAFGECQNLSGELHLPINSKLDAIRMNTFYNCSKLTGTLTIPSNIKKIGYGAFNNCDGFTSLILNEGLEEISVKIDSGDNFEKLGSFSSCDGLSGQLILPDGLKVIGQYSFSEKTGNNAWDYRGDINIKGPLVIPQSVTTIENHAFAGCTGFKGSALTIPKGNSLTSIGDYAFASCEFDYSFWDNPPSQSEIWIAFNSQDTDKAETSGVSSVDGNNGINNGTNISTNATSVGNDICYGYQMKVGYFKREN